MDMEILQEYTENQYYLRALTTVNFDKIEIKTDQVTEEVLAKNKPMESLDDILAQPLGNMMFRFHLLHMDAVEYLLFLNEVEHFEAAVHAPNSFRKSLALKIFKRYIENSHAKMPLKLPAHIRNSLNRFFNGNKSSTLPNPNDDLFLCAKMAAFRVLTLSCFPSFLESSYYSRLLALRLTGTTVVKRESFEFIRVLGEGGFGKVFAVLKFDTRGMYACKALNKAKILEKKREKLIMNERNMLAVVSSPFIIGLKYAFQDDQTLYLVMDLLTGGDLQFHLNRFGVFSESWVKFYGAQIILALEFLHSRNIVYRDLKPDNCLLDESGFMKLTDLGLASFIKDGEPLHQHCGTRSYMAPEQTYGEAGYSKEVDFWALGILLFCMITGYNPFSKRAKGTAAGVTPQAGGTTPQPVVSPTIQVVPAMSTTLNQLLPNKNGSILSKNSDARDADREIVLGSPIPQENIAIVKLEINAKSDSNNRSDVELIKEKDRKSYKTKSKSPKSPLLGREISSHKAPNFTVTGVTPAVAGNKDLNLTLDLDSINDGSVTKSSNYLPLPTANSVHSHGSFYSQNSEIVNSPTARSKRLGSKISTHFRRGTEVILPFGATSPGVLKPMIDENANSESRDSRLKRYAELEERYKTILQNMVYPEAMSPEAKSLIQELLVIDPKVRLGSRSIQDIKSHAFFSNFDWDKMAKKHVCAPFVPSSTHVNADYLEAAYVGLAQSSKKSEDATIDDKTFKDFDFVDPMVYQYEIIDTVHDKIELAES